MNLSLRGILFSLFCGLSPNLLGNSDQVTLQKKDLTTVSSVETEFIPNALYSPAVQMDLPYEVSLWLNFSVSSHQTLRVLLSLSSTCTHSAAQHILVWVSTIRLMKSLHLSLAMERTKVCTRNLNRVPSPTPPTSSRIAHNRVDSYAVSYLSVTSSAFLLLCSEGSWMWSGEVVSIQSIHA